MGNDFFNHVSLASQVVLVIKNLPANAGDARDLGLIPGSGRYPGTENGNSLHYSRWNNPMERGDWRATVYGAAKHTPGRIYIFTEAFWNIMAKFKGTVQMPKLSCLYVTGEKSPVLSTSQGATGKVQGNDSSPSHQINCSNDKNQAPLLCESCAKIHSSSIF